jgi:hypothetical protein
MAKVTLEPSGPTIHGLMSSIDLPCIASVNNDVRAEAAAQGLHLRAPAVDADNKVADGQSAADRNVRISSPGMRDSCKVLT